MGSETEALRTAFESPRILHIETGNHLYGGALQVFYLLQGLQARKVRNLLLCPRGSGIESVSRDVAKVLPIGYRGEADGRLLTGTIRAIRRYRPQLVHVHSRRGADWWGGLAAQLTGTPAILSRRVDNREKPYWGTVKYRWYQRVITISRGILNVLEDARVAPGKIVCVPSGIPIEPVPRPCDRPWFLQQFNLPKGSLSVAVVAQLIPRKGHRFLIQAMPDLLRRFPQTRFLFFGQGPIEAQLKQQCRTAGFSEQVRFAGFRRDMKRILPCLDVVAHPAIREGLGIALLEAAAAQRPIVASAVGGIPEIVLDGVNGFLVPPGDPRALSRAIGSLLQDPGLRARFGRQGRRLANERFSTDAMVGGNLQVYRSVLAGGT